MDNKNPMDPIRPPASDNDNPIFRNQTPTPHPQQGNPDAFATNQNKNFDDIAARILEEAPPMTQNETVANNANQTTPEQQVFSATQNLASAEGSASMPNSNVHIGGNLKKLLNWKILTVGILGILLLTIGGISAFKGDFYWIRDIVGMGIPSDPQKAIKKAESNTSKLEGYKAAMDMKISGEMEGAQIGLSTTLDISERPKDKKAHVMLKSLELSLPEELGGGPNTDFNNSIVGTEAISDNNTIYVKVPVTDAKWYKIDQSSVENIQELNNFIPSIYSKETEESQNPLTAAVVTAASAGEETTDIYNYLTNIKRVKDEKVDGKNSYHYQADMDIAKVIGESGDMPSEYNDFVNKYLKTKVDIWVTKKEMVFNKLSLSLNMDMDMADFGAAGKMKVDMSIEMKMSDFNKSVTIDVPKDAEEFDEKIFEDMLGGNSIADSESSRNSQRESDVKLLQSALEAYYASNSSYPITSINSKGDDFIKELLNDNYLATSLKDPSHPNYYYSYTSTDGKGYTITYVEETDTGIEVKKITQ